MAQPLALARVSIAGGPVVVIDSGDTTTATTATVAGQTFADLPELLEAAGGEVGRIEAGATVDVEGAAILSVVGRPRKIACVGLNYRSHAEEGGAQKDAPHPIIFPKWDTALAGAFDDIPLPRESESVDFETELAFVFGRRCRRVAAPDAGSVVFGYAAANDVSMRDWQFHSRQWGPGKSWDRATPVGPVVVAAEALGGAEPDLRMTGMLNAEIMQDTRTSEMIFGVPQLVAYLTTFMTMEPGDLVLTGTTAGVGMARTPPRFLTDGDVFEIEIERIGVLRNRFLTEAATP